MSEDKQSSWGTQSGSGHMRQKWPFRHIMSRLAHWWRCEQGTCKGHFSWYKNGDFGATIIITNEDWLTSGPDHKWWMDT